MLMYCEIASPWALDMNLIKNEMHKTGFLFFSVAYQFLDVTSLLDVLWNITFSRLSLLSTTLIQL